jgi:hypothetical protein
MDHSYPKINVANRGIESKMGYGVVGDKEGLSIALLLERRGLQLLKFNIFKIKINHG